MTVQARLVALRVGDAEVLVDTERAAITAITTPTRSYVDPSGAGNILRLAVPEARGGKQVVSKTLERAEVGIESQPPPGPLDRLDPALV